MEIVQNPYEFELYRERVNQEVWLGNVFPRRVFKREPVSTRFFDSGDMTSSKFFELLISLCNEFDEEGFIFAAMSPDPERFALDHSGRFPAARFSRNDDVSSFQNFVLYGSDDAVAFQVFEIVILSDSGAFAAYGKRVNEYAAVSTFNQIDAQKNLPLTFSANFFMKRSELFDCIKDFKNFKITKQEFFEAWGSAQ